MPPSPGQTREQPEVEERRHRKREAAKQEVLRRLERLTIGGEALGDAEIRRRRERRRKRLQALAEALERSSQEGNGGAFEVYGQLKSTEDALKKMARKAKQLEAEAADLQVSHDRVAPYLHVYLIENRSTKTFVPILSSRYILSLYYYIYRYIQSFRL